MFLSLFLSKDQKLVKKWKNEHEKIVLLTNNVIAEYSKNHHKKAKKLLITLNNLVIDHVTDENIEFYKLLKDNKRLTHKNREAIDEFTRSFKDVKTDLMIFLTKHTREDAVLDDEFFVTITSIADVLIERIKFEEANLYSILDISRKEKKMAELKRAL